MPRAHVKPVALVAYSPNQASAATGIRPERIAAAVKNGELHAVRVGTKTRISFNSLQRWLDSHDPASRQRASV
jgi:excisionase family DNA binding protein